MRHYLLIFMTAFGISVVHAQNKDLDPEVSARNAKKELRSEQRTERERVRREEIAKKEQVRNIETGPKYKKALFSRRRKTKAAEPRVKAPDNTRKPDNTVKSEGDE